ncbi:SRPBCC domain-containing protein [Sporosarcina sp. FSL K6-2383]|uniref:SRPBCC family protein n=1 Tax=Sporosarcina sp. FSL K6-2383 TaxID=2921556 RepID=UPI00315B3F8A
MSTKIEITHTLNAPREIVFKAFSHAEHLKNWWGPKGWDFTISTFEFDQSGVFHYSQKSPDGDMMWVKFIYDEISVPEKFVYTQFFSDEEGNVVRAPIHNTWPLKVQNTFTFLEHDGKTTLTMIQTPVSATDEELKTFVESQDMIQGGFTGTFNHLEDYLSKN